MRSEMIEALNYPRQLILQIIEGRDCPHENLFEATSERCGNCDINSECHWISCLNDFDDFEDKPTHTLSASLRYGIRVVESFLDARDHDRALCDCADCGWIAEAQRLIQKFEQTLPPNRYRPVR